MKKLIRVAIGVAVLTAVAFVAPSPASASHGVNNGPLCGTTPPCSDAPPAATGHQGMPLPNIADPTKLAATDNPCVVLGEIVPGAPGRLTGTHGLLPPLVNEPSHSHFTFQQTVIVCGGTPLGVAADGGNDGHVIDLVDPAVEPVIPHPFDTHHGSTNDSGWSNQSDYGNGATEIAACKTPKDPNANKGDITTTGRGTGWVKYLRVGTVVSTWGCYSTGTWAGTVFSAALALAPPSVPAALGGGGIVASPQCVLPDAIEQIALGTRTDCGLTIAGPAIRSTAWL